MKSCNKKSYFFVGSYTEKDSVISNAQGKGISFLELNSDELKEIKSSDIVKNPSYLTYFDKKLYVSSEMFFEDGSLNIVDFSDEEFKLLKTYTSKGRATCHIAYDYRTKNIFFASYSSKSAGVYNTDSDNGKLFNYHGTGPNKERQEASHPHQVTVHGDEFFVCDLGSDKIWIHNLMSENKEIINHIDVPCGYGPRHLVFSPDKEMFYLACELIPKVLTYQKTDNKWTLINEVDSDSEEMLHLAAPAAIKLSYDCQRVFVSNRFSNGVRCFNVDVKTGELTFNQDIRLRGKCPRDFSLSKDGKHLLVLLQDSHSIEVYKIKDTTIDLVSEFDIGSPVCICEL